MALNLNWISCQTLLLDVLQWAEELPGPFDAVIGVPRSGMLPASLLATRWNTRLVDLERFLVNPREAVGQALLRENNPAARRAMTGRVLVVDDASSAGSTLGSIRWMLQGASLEVVYAAVYIEPGNKAADCFLKEVPQPRLFEWNWFRHQIIKKAILDIDGVLCRDWTLRPEQDQDPEFMLHMRDVLPLYCIERPVLGLVTSRLERYRAETEDWLQRIGVQYGFLEMHPATTPEERREAKDQGLRKAGVYAARDDAQLFVESDPAQARQIADMTRKPVLCPQLAAVLG